MGRMLNWRRRSASFSIAVPGEVSGFSLTELLMVLVVVGSLSTVGLTSFQQTIQRSQVDEVALRLRTALAMARAEAIKRGYRVVLCRQEQGTTQCAGTAATGLQQWSKGWLIFVDRNENRQFDSVQGEVLLSMWNPANEAVNLRWNRGDFVAYDSMGALDSLNGTFCVADRQQSAGYQRQLVLRASGRLRTATEVCGY